MPKLLTFLLYFCFSVCLLAQEDQVFIQQIEITGNKKTKKQTILREMDIAIGDSITLADLSPRLERNKNLIINTGLFVLVKMNIGDWNHRTNQITIEIEVVENWFIYPFPIFELADRNFNVWWSEQNRSLKRVNFGVRFYHINTTGRKDQLKLVLQYGYTQKYEVRYTLPTLNGNQNLGLTGELFFTRNKEIAYKTVDNHLLFHRNDDQDMLRRFRAGIGLSYRPGLRFFHHFKLDYQQNQIAQIVIDSLNPNYFLDGKTKQRLLYLRYEFQHENRDIKAYPLNGHFFSFVVEKEGLGIFKERNGFYLTATLAKYLSFTKKWSIEGILKGRTTLIRQTQPYNNYWALGYFEDFLRGYEFYVIDGLDYGYLKTSLRWEVLNINFHFGKYMPISQFRTMPLKIYLSLNNDFGYVNDVQFQELNFLGNQWLWGKGIGLDIVLINDKVIQIQYSLNHLNENGLFLHYRFNF